jgi:hypothetical protein
MLTQEEQQVVRQITVGLGIAWGAANVAMFVAIAANSTAWMVVFGILSTILTLALIGWSSEVRKRR